MRPDRNLDLTPAEADVGVMPLLLGELAHLVDEVQSLAEVLEPEDPPQVVLLDDLPFGDLSLERAKLLSLERRCSAPARHARFARKFGHPVPPIETNFREVACVVALARRGDVLLVQLHGVLDVLLGLLGTDDIPYLHFFSFQVLVLREELF